ncbi:Uncharacterized protein TCM_001733 [Theobroma cacao]|uniref:Uncharacterized protein n=1 Tax=Theobroma cacao TaxID=3641 RepID=A0A061DLA8_THECC|nr:Uncharacterized protein TCM_001733 [Theobroma cacao]
MYKLNNECCWVRKKKERERAEVLVVDFADARLEVMLQMLSTEDLQYRGQMLHFLATEVAGGSTETFQEPKKKLRALCMPSNIILSQGNAT